MPSIEEGGGSQLRQFVVDADSLLVSFLLSAGLSVERREADTAVSELEAELGPIAMLTNQVRTLCDTPKKSGLGRRKISQDFFDVKIVL
jgi:hypothetical protein